MNGNEFVLCDCNGDEWEEEGKGERGKGKETLNGLVCFRICMDDSWPIII